MNNKFKYCPMKYYKGMFGDCVKEQCTWYCQYPNGEGECAIHSLPGLFDGLGSIATQIATK